MRRSLSLAAAVIAALVLPLAAQAPPSIDEIVAKNLKAKGGAEKWKSVSSVRMTGKVSLHGMDLPMSVSAKRPNLSRQEITIQDKKLVQAFDGTTPWMINPMMGSDAAQELTGPQADMMKSDADFDGALMDYKEKGHKVEFVGKEKLDSTDVYHLKITKKGGNIQHYFLDAESGIELKTTAEMDQGGTKQNIETELSNYQAVDGIMIPHTVKQLVNGNPIVTMTIEKVEFNPTLDDSLFKMPAKK
jgi:outer membrane lipoprotein-sorting protein